MDVAVIDSGFCSILAFFVGDSAMLFFEAVLSLRCFAKLLQRQQWLDGWTATELAIRFQRRSMRAGEMFARLACSAAGSTATAVRPTRAV